MLTSDIPPKVERDINIIARTTSALSMLGCVFIISTFCLSASFRKPYTRLIFFASFGNIMTNIVMVMTRAYVSEPWTAGCQIQGFVQQWSAETSHSPSQHETLGRSGVLTSF